MSDYRNLKYLGSTLSGTVIPLSATIKHGQILELHRIAVRLLSWKAALELNQMILTGKRILAISRVD